MAWVVGLGGHSFGLFESVISSRGSCCRAAHCETKVEVDAGVEAVEDCYGLAEVEFEDKDGGAKLVEAIDSAVDTGA